VAHGGVAITHLQAEWARAKCPCQMPSNIEFSYANQEILMPHPGDEMQMQSGEGVDVGWRHVPSASVSWAPNSELATQCVCTEKNYATSVLNTSISEKEFAFQHFFVIIEV